MQLPVKAHYATLAMLALAERHASLELLPARVIAREQRIPSQFLGQILQQLRAAGLINSTRGASGGFRLSREPAAISMADIVDAVCPLTTSCGQWTDASRLSSAIQGVWQELEQHQRRFFERMTLDDLLRRVEHTPATMFYI